MKTDKVSTPKSIFNLECVLGNSSLKKLVKNGPNLICESDAINGIKALNPSLVLLANNHILDYGTKGLDNTINLLEKRDIKYTGIIDNINAHVNVSYFEKDGIKVGIYNLCENEFSVATKSRKGTNGLYDAKNYIDIMNAKKSCNYLIVIYHGGKEFYRYPSPRLQSVCHNFIDCGADFVITQHSHAIGCEEVYFGKKIIYGQGNFIFDCKNDEYWNSEMIVELEVNKNGINSTNIFINTQEHQLITDDTLKESYNNRSNKITEPGFIEEEYNKFSASMLNNYMARLNKKNIIKKIMNKLTGGKYYERRYNLSDYVAILNYLECEAHRELLIEGIKNKIHELEK